MLSTPPYVASPGSCGWRAWDTGTMPPLPSHLAAPHFYAVQSILGSLMPHAMHLLKLFKFER